MKKVTILITLFLTVATYCQKRIYLKDNSFKEVKDVRERKGVLVYEDKNGEFKTIEKKDYLFFVDEYIAKEIDTSYFKAKDKKLIWQKVFYKKEEKLINHFTKEVITNISAKNLQQIDNTISFEIENDIVEYRNYGGTWANTLTFIKFPLNYLVSIDFKKNKYRVTVKSIKSYAGLQFGFINFNDVLILKNGEIKQSKTSKRGLNYLNIHFIKKFIISNEDKEEW